MVAARCLGAAMMVMMKSGEAFSGKRGSQFGQTSLFDCVVKMIDKILFLVIIITDIINEQ